MIGDMHSTMNLTWFGHSCFRIVIDGTIVFFDPVRRNDLLRTTLDPPKEGEPHAIFISHEHWDHCDPKTVIDLCSESTKIFGPSSIENPLVHEMTFNVADMNELGGASKRISIVKSDDHLLVNDIKIKCLSAQEGLSYLLLAGDKKLLFLGDSPATPDMIAETPDIILFPIWAVKGEESKLDEFLTLARNALCIPMHYHSSSSSLPNFNADMGAIKQLLLDVNMKILHRNEPFKIWK